jgi:uncharacterized protein with von Willebrand factor type A (vWA) domain
MKYKPNGFFEPKEIIEKRNNTLGNIETEVNFTRKEVEENLLAKEYNGECSIKYNGKERQGIILSLGTSGSMIIGILKEE